MRQVGVGNNSPECEVVDTAYGCKFEGGDPGIADPQAHSLLAFSHDVSKTSTNATGGNLTKGF